MAQLCRRFAILIAVAGVTTLLGCRDPPHRPLAEGQSVRPTGVITLGDIDPDEPATRVRRIQPLADFLGERLHDVGIGRGHVLIARDISEMSRLMSEGKVDLFLDSPFPVLAVNRAAQSKSLLLRKAKQDAEYWTVFITRADSALNGLADLRGQVTAFQEPYSTSGFLLPAAMLIDQGFSLQAVARPDAVMSGDDVGCHFSGDEENTIELVLNGDVRVGTISNQDFRELPEATRQRLKILDRTDSVPRQLVAARSDLAPELIAAVRSALLAMTDEDRVRLAGQDAPLGWTWKFSPLSTTAVEMLAKLETKMDLLPACIAAQ